MAELVKASRIETIGETPSMVFVGTNGAEVAVPLAAFDNLARVATQRLAAEQNQAAERTGGWYAATMVSVTTATVATAETTDGQRVVLILDRQLPKEATYALSSSLAGELGQLLSESARTIDGRKPRTN